MKKILGSVLALAMAFMGIGALATVTAEPVMAANGGLSNVKNTIDDANNGNTVDAMGTVKVIINVVLGVIGLIAVVMIILGGINYTTSQGDAAKVKKATSTILYGVIGLVVALLAFAIVNFVLTNVFSTKLS